MPKSTTDAQMLVKTMGKEVFELFAEKESFSLSAFRAAFANVAHKHEVFHGRERGQYNYLFGVVMTEVKHLIKQHNQLVEKHGLRALPQPGPQRKVRKPVLDPSKLKYTLRLF